MSLNTKKKVQEIYYNAFSSLDSKEELEHSTKMLMYRFLSEVERLAEEKNLNRKELAALIGTSASYITQLFRGTKIINLETIAKFQKALNVTFKVEAVESEQEFETLSTGGKLQEFEIRARGNSTQRMRAS